MFAAPWAGAGMSLVTFGAGVVPCIHSELEPVEAQIKTLLTMRAQLLELYSHQ